MSEWVAVGSVLNPLSLLPVSVKSSHPGAISPFERWLYRSRNLVNFGKKYRCLVLSTFPFESRSLLLFSKSGICTYARGSPSKGNKGNSDLLFGAAEVCAWSFEKTAIEQLIWQTKNAKQKIQTLPQHFFVIKKPVLTRGITVDDLLHQKVKLRYIKVTCWRNLIHKSLLLGKL